MEPDKTQGDATPDNQLNMVAGRPVLDLDKFDCPQCRSTRYHYVYVHGRNGQSFKMPFYMCAGCSVMFGDAWRFKRLIRHTTDGRGMPDEVVTRGVDDRPVPGWNVAFQRDKPMPPGGYTKRPIDL